jgi:hypothetical protein
MSMLIDLFALPQDLTTAMLPSKAIPTAPCAKRQTSSVNCLVAPSSPWVLVLIAKDVSTSFILLIIDGDADTNHNVYLWLGVYLHDPRIICREAKTKTRRKNREDTAQDSLFWPVMPATILSQRLDGSGQPQVVQPYIVPPASSEAHRRHDDAVYSLWMHFVDYCSTQARQKPVPDTSNQVMNPYTHRQRLPIFRALSLSNGKSISALAPLPPQQSSSRTIEKLEEMQRMDREDDSWSCASSLTSTSSLSPPSLSPTASPTFRKMASELRRSSPDNSAAMWEGEHQVTYFLSQHAF